MNNQKIITNSAAETQKYAEELAKELRAPTVITLKGDLGAGKTTFTQGFAKGLRIKEKIISPTFIIIRSYQIKMKGQKLKINDMDTQLTGFYHVDLYRLESENDIERTELLDILQENNSIVVIEWPEKMGKLLPKKRIDISLKYIGENKRQITINDNY